MMSLLGMVWQNIRGGAFRSAVILACAMLVTGMTLGVFMILRSGQFQIEQSLNRMGADIMVVAWGNTNQYIRGAHLLSEPSQSWIQNIVIDRIKLIPGVAKVTPQLYLTALKASLLANGADVMLVGLNPQTDITVHPWLSDPDARDLHPGEVWVGSNLALQPGSPIDLYEMPLTVRGKLISTRTELDHAIFVDLDTAHRLANRSSQADDGSIKIVPGTSSVLLADEPTSDLDEQTEQEIMLLFKRFHTELGVTVLLVSHTNELVAFGTRALRMASEVFVN